LAGKSFCADAATPQSPLAAATTKELPIATRKTVIGKRRIFRLGMVAAAKQRQIVFNRQLSGPNGVGAIRNRCLPIAPVQTAANFARLIRP
jgi:hypothetical protein